MDQLNEMPLQWKSITTVDEAKQLVDCGILLRWSDMRHFKKIFDDQGQVDIVRHFASRLGERVEEGRLSEEILIESVLIILTNRGNDELLNSFIEELLLQPNYVEASLTLVEVSIGFDLSVMEHGDEIFAMAVGVICELGIVIQQIQESHAGNFENANQVLDHIATYLLSVSNSNNSCIRLSLINYFGYSELDGQKSGFNRIMGRFGYTVLELLFNMLFQKRTEAMSLQYLLENIPYMLEGDQNCQKILHETWKFYMLKKPDRFSLFIKTLSGYLKSLNHDRFNKSKDIFLQHMGALLKIVSDVNHKNLVQEILYIIVDFDGCNAKEQMIDKIKKDGTIRSSYKEFLNKLLDSEVIEGTSALRPAKRGRRPSFARVEDVKTLQQVTFLGQRNMARAS